MAEKAAKQDSGYSEDAEFRFLGNLCGLLMACAGLLAGTMVREFSVDYWLEDIVPLLLFFFTLRGLVKSSMELARDSMYYAEQRKQVEEALAKQQEMLASLGEEEPMELPRIAPKTKYSEDEVLEAVAKRIEEQKERAMKSNKMTS